MLAATVGQEFLPYIDQASLWLQQTARWVEGLDESTKRGAARWAMYGVAVLGVVAVLPRVIAAAQALSAVLAFSLANPVTAAIVAVGALTAAVLALSGAFDRAGASAAGFGGKAGAMAADTRRIQAGIVQHRDYMTLPEETRKGIESRQGAARKAFLEGREQEAHVQIESMRGDLPAKLKTIREATEQINKVWQVDWGTRATTTFERRIARALGMDYDKQCDEARQLIFGAKGENGKLDPEAIAELARRPIREQERRVAILGHLQGGREPIPPPQRDEELKRSFAGLLPQPAYVGIGQLQERFQLAALQPEGDLDRKLQELQNANLEKILGIMSKVEENTKWIRHQVPAFSD